MRLAQYLRVLIERDASDKPDPIKEAFEAAARDYAERAQRKRAE